MRRRQIMAAKQMELDKPKNPEPNRLVELLNTTNVKDPMNQGSKPQGEYLLQAKKKRIKSKEIKP